MSEDGMPTGEDQLAREAPASATSIQEEIAQNRPFHSLGGEVTVSLLRTAAVIDRVLNQVTAPHGITIQQYNVLRILRGAGTEGLPTLTLRNRMVHEAPGVTRLVDRLEQAGLVRRERCSPDRRQVLCYITPQGLALLDALDGSINAADDASVTALDEAEQRTLVKLLGLVRAGHRQQSEPSER
jgi:DNA-binding MarR family transcriptional regulator